MRDDPVQIRRRSLLAAGFLLLTLPAARPARAAAAERLGFDQLYKSFGVRGLEFSDRLLALKGQTVTIRGYMAPPLKPESNFFVLTREPVSLCPFCQSDAEWPEDIVVIYLSEAAPMGSGGEAVTVTGTLEVGSWVDPATGFVSQIRITNASQRMG